MDKDSNVIQIFGGKRRILLDVVDRSKELPNNSPRKSGTFFSIDASKGIIYYADEDLNLKILIEKSE